MATILAYTSPARGHLFPMMDILLELKSRGHRVVVQTLASEKSHVEDAGIEHLAIGSAIEALELTDYQAKSPPDQFIRAIQVWLSRAPHELDDLRQSIAEIQPDYLVIDANAFGAMAFAEKAGLPWALHMPYCLPTTSKDAPAFGPGFPPPKTLFARIRDAVVRSVFQRLTREPLRELNAFRTSQGCPTLARVEDIYSIPPVILYRTAEPFEYPRSDWAPNVQQLGPGLWAPDEALPDWFLAMPEPRTLVSISTESQDDSAIMRIAIDALKDEPGSVICTSAAEDPATFLHDAGNVKVVRFLPHARVMPYLDCVVTHGGMGTVQRALTAGIPMCVVPWGRDQNESAQRVVTANAGSRLARKDLKTANLRDAVQKARKCSEGARAVAEGFRNAGGATRGADLVESRVG